MTVDDLPYPLRLCVELLNYAGASCPKTQYMTATEIKAATSVFFDESMIEEATDILCGRSKKTYKEGKLQADEQETKDYGSNAGIRCDTDSGPCACGAWH